jgi:putative Ca2+/H+ antiporter (TMEM165/GDT1 family)
VHRRQSLFLGGLAVAAPAAHAAADVGSVTAFLDRTLGPGFVQAFSLILVSELGDKVAKQKGGG